jgi:hypothetical protein
MNKKVVIPACLIMSMGCGYAMCQYKFNLEQKTQIEEQKVEQQKTKTFNDISNSIVKSILNDKFPKTKYIVDVNSHYEKDCVIISIVDKELDLYDMSKDQRQRILVNTGFTKDMESLVSDIKQLYDITTEVKLRCYDMNQGRPFLTIDAKDGTMIH